MDIGNRIRALREEKGLTQLELSKELKVARQTVAQWENEERDLKTGTIIALAKYFDVTADYILGLSDYTTAECNNIGQVTGLTDESIKLLSEYAKKNCHDKTRNENTNEALNVFLQNILRDDLPECLAFCWEVLKYTRMETTEQEKKETTNSDDNKRLIMNLSSYVLAINEYNLCMERITKIVKGIVEYDEKQTEKISRILVENSFNIIMGDETLGEEKQNGND